VPSTQRFRCAKDNSSSHLVRLTRLDDMRRQTRAKAPRYGMYRYGANAIWTIPAAIAGDTIKPDGSVRTPIWR
jgi:hypothetical protein